jgi:hypothetical protein
MRAVHREASCSTLDSSVSPTHGEQENGVWNGHYEYTCYHPLFVFNAALVSRHDRLQNALPAISAVDIARI